MTPTTPQNLAISRGKILGPVDECVDRFPEVGFTRWMEEGEKESLKLNEILKLPSPNGQVYRL